MSGNDVRQLVPRLRFPEFREMGEWEKSQLSEHVSSLDAGVSVVSGDRSARSNEVGILKTSAVTDGAFSPQENKVVLDKGELQRVKEPVSENSIIISRMNTPALVGANAYIANSLENIFLPDRLWAAKPKRNTSMRFIAFILGSAKGRAALSKLATGTSGSMKNITKPDVLALEITAPSFDEQQKIADCLSSLDERIAAEATKLDTLKAHKKGLMQQLFPAEGETVPRLRFGEFREGGEWNISPLSKIAENLDNRRIPVTESNRIKGNIPYYGASGIIDYIHDYIFDEDLLCISEDGANLLARTTPIAFSISGKSWVNNHAHVLRFTNKHIQKLVEDYLNSIPLDDFLTGMAQPKLNRAMLDTIPAPLPQDKIEQKKIADCLSSLDDLMTAQAQKIEMLKRHKKGLMQQLFPSTAGEIQV